MGKERLITRNRFIKLLGLAGLIPIISACEKILKPIPTQFSPKNTLIPSLTNSPIQPEIPASSLTPEPTQIETATPMETPVSEFYDWNFVSQKSDEEIFNVIGIPNPAEYSLNQEISPSKILRNEGGQSYALCQNSEGIVLLAENLETRVVEHAVYAEYEGGVPVLLLTDAAVVEHDNGWFQLNNSYPASEAQNRFAEAFNRGLAMRWWAVNHPEDGGTPHGIKKWLSEIPGFQAMEFDPLTKAERTSISDYILQTFLENLHSAKADDRSMPIELTDRNHTEFDATKETIIIKATLSGDMNWQIIFNHTSDSYHQFLKTKKDGSFVTVLLRQPAFMPTRIPTRPVGGNITNFLRYFFGAEYYYEISNTQVHYVNQDDMTGPILEDMCTNGSLPDSLFNYESRTYPNYDTTHLSPATNICAIVFGK